MPLPAGDTPRYRNSSHLPLRLAGFIANDKARQDFVLFLTQGARHPRPLPGKEKSINTYSDLCMATTGRTETENQGTTVPRSSFPQFKKEASISKVKRRQTGTSGPPGQPSSPPWTRQASRQGGRPDGRDKLPPLRHGARQERKPLMDGCPRPETTHTYIRLPSRKETHTRLPVYPLPISITPSGMGSDPEIQPQTIA